MEAPRATTVTLAFFPATRSLWNGTVSPCAPHGPRREPFADQKTCGSTIGHQAAQMVVNAAQARVPLPAIAAGLAGPARHSSEQRSSRAAVHQPRLVLVLDFMAFTMRLPCSWWTAYARAQLATVRPHVSVHSTYLMASLRKAKCVRGGITITHV